MNNYLDSNVIHFMVYTKENFLKAIGIHEKKLSTNFQEYSFFKSNPFSHITLGPMGFFF